MKTLGAIFFVMALGPAGQGQEGETPIKQDRRFVSVKNDTKEKLFVFLQYETYSATKKGWYWYPKGPDSDEAVAYVIAAGQTLALKHEDWPVSARCIRIWARSEGGAEFNEYRDDELWIVEERPGGERYYMAPRGETFTFTFDS